MILWTIYGIFYRLYWHPLAKYPGPKLAIITYWYEFYYDAILEGQYTWKLRDLHEKYGKYRPSNQPETYGEPLTSWVGPMIRINPDELHFNDPDYYDEIYNNRDSKVEKPFKEANAFGPFPAVRTRILLQSPDY